METLNLEKTVRRTQPDNVNCPALRSKLDKLQRQLKELCQREN